MIVFPYWNNISINIGKNKPQKITFWFSFHRETILVNSLLGFVYTDFEINLREKTFIHGQLVGTSLYSHCQDHLTGLLAWNMYIHDVHQVAHTVANDFLAHNL